MTPRGGLIFSHLAWVVEEKGKEREEKRREETHPFQNIWKGRKKKEEEEKTCMLRKKNSNGGEKEKSGR